LQNIGTRERIFVPDNPEKLYAMSINDDTFIHFTLKERADKIIDSGILQMNPPYEKFGGDAIYAISTTYGQLVSGVQTTHLKSDEEIVALAFETTTIPKVGFAEEVGWERNVPLSNAKIMDKESGEQMVQSSSEKISESAHVLYYQSEVSELQETIDQYYSNWKIYL